MPRLAVDLGTPPAIVDRVRREYQERLDGLQATADEVAAPRPRDQGAALRLAANARKRSTLLDVHDQGTIDDSVLVEIQGQLDQEELRLSRRVLTD